MKTIKKNIKDFFITNHLLKKIKIFLNNYVRAIFIKLLISLIVLAIILFISIKIFKPNLAEKTNILINKLFVDSLKLNSLNFSKINVGGNQRITKEQIIEVVNNYENNSDEEAQLANNQVSLSQIQNLIDELKIKLPWINKITIKRAMPDILNIEIEEYQPFAIWINDNKKYIIDKDGNTVPYLDEYDNNPEFKSMIILSGRGANKNVESLFNILASDEEISQKIYSATWVGNRRWDVRFFDGLLVKLPELEISQAWSDLIKFYNLYENDKTIKSIDLRVSGKIYLQFYEKKSLDKNISK